MIRTRYLILTVLLLSTGATALAPTAAALPPLCHDWNSSTSCAGVLSDGCLVYVNSWGAGRHCTYFPMDG